MTNTRRGLETANLFCKEGAKMVHLLRPEWIMSTRLMTSFETPRTQYVFKDVKGNQVFDLVPCFWFDDQGDLWVAEAYYTPVDREPEHEYPDDPKQLYDLCSLWADLVSYLDVGI